MGSASAWSAFLSRRPLLPGYWRMRQCGGESAENSRPPAFAFVCGRQHLYLFAMSRDRTAAASVCRFVLETCGRERSAAEMMRWCDDMYDVKPQLLTRGVLFLRRSFSMAVVSAVSHTRRPVRIGNEKSYLNIKNHCHKCQGRHYAKGGCSILSQPFQNN